MEIRNNVAEIRRACSLSVQNVSDLTGISVPTLYGIESERYLPNTATALKLAWVFCVPVEELFQLASPPPGYMQGEAPCPASAGSWCCP
jgi:putative transcriptional regulator